MQPERLADTTLTASEHRIVPPVATSHSRAASTTAVPCRSPFSTTASPTLIPMRSATASGATTPSPAVRFRSSTTCWIATAHLRPAAVLVKPAMTPSPVDLVTTTPWASSAASTRESRPALISSKASSPTRTRIAVEPT